MASILFLRTPPGAWYSTLPAKSGNLLVMPTVVIADCDHGSIDPERELLEAAGVELRLGPSTDADVLIVQYATVDGALLDRMPRVRAVIRYGVGVDTIDVDAATARGVWVVNVPDYGTEEVADHAVALMLSLLRGVGLLDRSVREGAWDHRAAGELRRLSALTLGVVGHGRIGAAAAGRAIVHGMRVGAHDVRADAVRPPAERASFDALLEGSDVISLHVPLTADTHHLIGAAAIARMRAGAFLVNTSRGGVIDGAAVLEALDAGPLAGAALDVFEAEPPQGAERELARHPRVIATPHAAWWSRESELQLKREVAREALRVLEGRRPRSPVNRV
jgi:D-3-phosphoglycerate dehydrogenase / 2-oxoglutarate reductase